MKSMLLVAAFASFFSIASAAYASPISIYNTGVDDSGNVLADGAAESHYHLISSPNGSTDIKVLAGSEYPANGPWANDTAFSHWIAPNTSSGLGPTGTYDYRISFSLSDTQGTILAGVFAADDGATISLNGVDTGNVANGFSVLQPFSIQNGFKIGNNDLDFFVYNGLFSTGLRVELNNTNVPEPATVALLGLGLLGFAVSRRKSENSKNA